jgi:CheY-like chemotaxis protein
MADQSPQNKFAKLGRQFREFIKNKRIVIADPHAHSRSSLTHMLIDLGALSKNIELTNSYFDCKQAIEREFPDLLISEYDLEGGRCGLDLLQDQRKMNSKSQSSLFILITGNTSQAAVARAAEEDVDGYVIKPFSMDVLRSSIMKYAITKAYPTDYMKEIQKGKEQIAKRQLDDAMLTFDRAAGLDEKPSLAHFYHGQAELLRKTLSNAEIDYDKGLSYNKIHYKCLAGLFDLYYSQNRNKEAYAIVRKISQYFPANPDRLATVLRLAIINNAFGDIERYYQLFCKLEKRDAKLVKHVSAALIVCGRYYLMNGIHSRSLELFTKAKIASAYSPRFLREIVANLLEYSMATEAEAFLADYPNKEQAPNDYVALKFAAESFKFDISQAANIADGLVKKGIKDYLIYEVLLRRSVQSNRIEAADALYQTALELFPERKETFDYIRENVKFKVNN